MRHPGTILLFALLPLLPATGCGVRLTPKTPTVAEDLDDLRRDLDVLPPFTQPRASSGSLWTDGGPGAALVRDARAFRINDLVTITVNERSLGSNEATTDLNRDSSADYGASVAFGLENPSAAAGRFNLAQVLSSSAESSFSADGETTRGNQLLGSVTARVMQVLPNGNLVLAGRKTVMINRERHVLTLVGTARPVDVSATNRLSSDVVGELTIRLWGRGEIDATTQQGWFMKFLQRLWPF